MNKNNQMEELVYQLKQAESKEKAFKQLMTTYQNVLYNHIYRYVNHQEDARDVLQNTFIKIWRNIDNFRGDCSLFSWLYRIASNEAISFLNSRNKKRTLDIEQTNAINKSGTDNESAAHIETKFHSALSQLPEKQKQIFIMRYFDELTYEQISEITDTSVGALKASYHHAVKKIEQNLLEH